MITQRIDIETRIGLVEDREARLHQCHLQNLVALLLAAAEARVDGAVQEVFVISTRSIAFCAASKELDGHDFGLAPRARTELTAVRGSTCC